MTNIKSTLLVIFISFLSFLCISLVYGNYKLNNKVSHYITISDALRESNFMLQSQVESLEIIVSSERLAHEKITKEMMENKDKESKLLKSIESLKREESVNEGVKEYLSTPIPDDIRRLLNSY